MIESEPITDTPTVHAALAAALTTSGGAAVAARFEVEGDVLTCAMFGREFTLAPEVRVGSATVYGTRKAPNGPTHSGAADVLAIADDGRVFAGQQAFEAGAAPLCRLADSDPRAAIVAHLAATLPTRRPR